MAHNNRTPVTILTAPSPTVKQVVSLTPTKVEDPNTHEVIGTKVVPDTHHPDYQVDQLTGQAINNKRPERKARAALKRARRNKHGHSKKG